MTIEFIIGLIIGVVLGGVIGTGLHHKTWERQNLEADCIVWCRTFRTKEIRLDNAEIDGLNKCICTLRSGIIIPK